jgi:hypothetical protein
MNLTRRRLLKGVLLAGATTAGAAMARATKLANGNAPAALLIYDSRWSQSRALCIGHSGHSIDVVHEHASCWRNLRNLRPLGRVVGLTSWSDLVQARGLFEEKGKRLQVESRCGRLFYWEMA